MMPSGARLDWDGDGLIERVHRAAAAAVDETLDAARDDAELTHTWQDDPRMRTGKSGGRFDSHLEHNIKSEHTDPADANPSGRFGYTQRTGFYGLFHETGTTREHEFPALRPAGDRNFPTLAERIARRLR